MTHPYSDVCARSDFHRHAALGADGQDVACALAEGGVDAGLELVEDIIGNEGLNGAGEAAAVDAVCAPALEVVLTQAQSNGHGLLLDVTGRDDVLQVHPGGVAGLLGQLQEALKVTGFQGCHLLDHPAVLVILVDGAHNGAVAALFAEHGDGCIELVLGDLVGDLLAEVVTDRLQLQSDGSVLVSQVSMVGTGVDDAQGVTMPT